MIEKLAQCDDAATRRSARRHSKAPANLREVSKKALLGMMKTLSNPYDPADFGALFELLGGLRGLLPLSTLEFNVGHPLSFVRLTAALALPACSVPLTGDDAHGLTTRDLLEHLSHDGNRLVRWAAQTRLADPDFVFSGLCDSPE